MFTLQWRDRVNLTYYFIDIRDQRRMYSDKRILLAMAMAQILKQPDHIPSFKQLWAQASVSPT